MCWDFVWRWSCAPSLGTHLKAIIAMYTGRLPVKATSLNVRSDAGTGCPSVGRLHSRSCDGSGRKAGTDGNTWYQIQYTREQEEQSVQGYVSCLYIRLPVNYTTDAEFEAYLTSQGFPETL